MRDHHRVTIGIRLRAMDGRKWAVQGSRNGLFYPELGHNGPILLPEGPTDTAAMLTLEFDAIGRPFCRGGISMLHDVFARLKREDNRRPAVIVADQDKPGIDGAAATAEALFGVAEWVKIIMPPPGIKDARAWLQAGATHDSVMFVIDNTEFWSPPEA